MSINGKYVFVSEEGFPDFLAQQGVPADKIKEMTSTRDSYEFKMEGQKITEIHSFGNKPRTLEYTIGQEFEDKMGERVSKNVASLNGNELTIVSTGGDGNQRSKIFKFSATGLEVVHKTSKGEGKLNYKRA